MARSFNGTTDKIDCGTGVTAPTPAVSISAWVYMTSLTPAYSSVYGRVNSADFHSVHQILVKSTGHIGYFVAVVGVASFLVDPGTNAISTGSWHHVALTCNPSLGGPLTGFLDGLSDGTQSRAADTIGTSFGTNHTCIGFDDSAAGRNLGGRIADAAMWNVVLTAAEIKALAVGARPNMIRPANLLHWLPLDGLQSPEPDLSGFANNGTLTGTTIAPGPPIMPFTPRWPQVNSLPLLGPAAGLGWIINRRNRLSG